MSEQVWCETMKLRQNENNAVQYTRKHVEQSFGVPCWIKFFKHDFTMCDIWFPVNSFLKFLKKKNNKNFTKRQTMASDEKFVSRLIIVAFFRVTERWKEHNNVIDEQHLSIFIKDGVQINGTIVIGIAIAIVITNELPCLWKLLIIRFEIWKDQSNYGVKLMVVCFLAKYLKSDWGRVCFAETNLLLRKNLFAFRF